MADDQDTNGPDGEALDPNIREELRKAREVTKERDAATAELASLRREHAFTQAGIPEAGPGALFRKAYDGDLDVTAVKTAAEGYGVLQVASAESGMTEEEKASLQRISSAGTGLPPQGQNSFATFQADLNKATSSEEVMAMVRRHQAEHPEDGMFVIDQ